MFTIPCPDDFFISTELSSGLGRRLPCYNTEQCVIIVKEENTSAAIEEIGDEQEENSSTEASKHNRHSVHPAYHHHSDLECTYTYVNEFLIAVWCKVAK